MPRQVHRVRPTELPSGLRVLNCTPHPITFAVKPPEQCFCNAPVYGGVCDWNGHVLDTVTVPPSGYTLPATVCETVVGQIGCAVLVQPVFDPSPKGWAELGEIQETYPDALVIGSIISAQAYPGRVVAMIPAPGFERVPPAEKRMSVTRFTTFSHLRQ